MFWKIYGGTGIMFPAKKNTTRAEKTGIWRIPTGITNLALKHGGIKWGEIFTTNGLSHVFSVHWYSNFWPWFSLILLWHCMVWLLRKRFCININTLPLQSCRKVLHTRSIHARRQQEMRQWRTRDGKDVCHRQETAAVVVATVDKNLQGCWLPTRDDDKERRWWETADTANRLWWLWQWEVGDNGGLRQLRQTLMAAETNSTQDDRQGTRLGGNHRHRGR